MKEKSVKEFLLKNILLLILFGFVVTAISTSINYYMENKKIENRLQKDASFLAQQIEHKLKQNIHTIERSIHSTQINPLFIEYLKNPTDATKRYASYLLLNNMHDTPTFFQYRFIDPNGMEKIRVDKDRNSSGIFVAAEKDLQDKSHRYYFQETLEKQNTEYWYSYIDLNVEHNEIEKPIRPTYRVASPVKNKDNFYGILIVNVEIQEILADIKNSIRFDVYLFDSDGNYIAHPKSSKEWSKDLKSGYTIYKDIPSIDKNQFHHQSGKYEFVYSMENIFKNGQGIRLALKAKESYIKSLLTNNLMSVGTLGLIIFLISIPMAFIIALPTSKLYVNFNRLHKENLRYLDTLDKYVSTMIVDVDKKIKDVSEALCKLSGYSKDELIGQSPSIFTSGQMPDELYKELWTTITNGFVWNGELENRGKNKKIFWVNTTILPNFDKDHNIDSYTAISENVTEKKLLEIVSKTDKLTQVYNRMELDKCLENEYNRYQRHKNVFSVILIDIDHFKSVNDTYGHQVGDSVLIEMANLLKENSRKTDIVGRWGGEEFMVICIDTDIDGATILAENLRKATETFAFNVVKHKTISVGVSEINDTDNIETLLKRTDKHLYNAKESGRNQVISDI